MGATCSGCGACCDLIPLDQTPEQIAASVAAWPDAVDNHYFGGDYLVPVTKAEAEQINPALVRIHPSDKSWYTCRAFDATSRRCTIYETRPKMCRNYPWYEWGPRGIVIKAFPDCSYHADVPDSCGAGLVQLTRT